MHLSLCIRGLFMIYHVVFTRLFSPAGGAPVPLTTLEKKTIVVSSTAAIATNSNVEKTRVKEKIPGIWEWESAWELTLPTRSTASSQKTTTGNIVHAARELLSTPSSQRMDYLASWQPPIKLWITPFFSTGLFLRISYKSS